ncbi:Gfo/Idh/MocA family protein [Hirschia maritima]|uniref:Gfo/Idh/MocA family protein n=1 Tax=Hirschia maritima TaxID=1121961 RepID=UPI000368B34F|nr:Gfo/Idh/MocA family oxidoreductase [Hirschia maritima]
MTKKIRVGMIGGGPGAFIGAIHRRAMWLDNRFEIVAGAFSRDAEKSRQMAAELGVDADRAHTSADKLMEAEKLLPVEDRIQCISVVTPNAYHYEACALAVENGFHIVCDKPPTRTLEETIALKELLAGSPSLYALTFTYLGYPMVHEARSRVLNGDIGKIRKVFVQYPQGWLSTPLEKEEVKQASWRTDPALSGPAGCLGDIGTHAFSLAEFISGKKVNSVCADIRSFVDGRLVDDDVSVLMGMSDDVSGVLLASQIMAGEENALTIKVYGETGGFQWSHSDPNTLIHMDLNGPTQILRAGQDNGYLSAQTQQLLRTPSGHPEGFIEAFSNIYGQMADAIVGNGELGEGVGIEAGERVMRFVDAVLTNAISSEKWTEM